ncbi:MAG: ribonuclease H-like domain-containing protein, partial [Candidatus Absconditabacteria bacterium]
RFFLNLKTLYQREKYFYFRDFVKDLLKEGSDIIYFEANQPVFRIIKKESFRLIDEREKIEVELDEDGMNKIHNFLKDEKKVTKLRTNNKTILETLLDKFMNGGFSKINGKDFIVYDIETIGNINDLRSMKFMMAYCIGSDDSQSMNYRYVDESSLQKFANYLLEFDGYIIGYNNIYFDNPVVGYNVGWSDEQINVLKNKSIDLFLFIWNLTKRRVGLNFVSTALLGLGKTLESGLEGENYLKQYLSSGDKKLLTKVKNYCKNDVKMTLGVLLYILEYKRLCFDDLVYDFDEDYFVDVSKRERKTKEKIDEKIDNGMF